MRKRSSFNYPAGPERAKHSSNGTSWGGLSVALPAPTANAGGDQKQQWVMGVSVTPSAPNPPFYFLLCDARATLMLCQLFLLGLCQSGCRGRPGGTEMVCSSLLPSCGLLVCWWSLRVSLQHHAFTHQWQFLPRKQPIYFAVSIKLARPDSSHTPLHPEARLHAGQHLLFRVWVMTSQAPFSELRDTSLSPASLPSQHQGPLPKLWSFKNLNLFL